LRYILLVLILFSSASISDESSQQQCGGLFQSWVFNNLLEKQCGFGGMLSYRFGILVKAGCDNELSEETRNALALEVFTDVKRDYESMGMAAFCEAARPGYEEAVDSFAETFNKDDLK